MYIIQIHTLDFFSFFFFLSLSIFYEQIWYIPKCFFLIFVTETISRTGVGQPRPKYIFNKCGTNIYFFFTLQRFGSSPSPNFKYNQTFTANQSPWDALHGHACGSLSVRNPSISKYITKLIMLFIYNYSSLKMQNKREKQRENLNFWY